MNCKPFLLAVLAAILTGCVQNAVGQAEKTLGTSAPAALGDAGTVALVEAALVGIDPDSALHVAVAAHDGNVTLSGRAKSASISAHFAEAAKNVKGVKTVSSRITVDPKLPSTTTQAKDFGLAAEVSAALIGQAGINAFSVRPTAHGSVVTLTGTVKSDAIKSTMIETAKHVAGVSSVVDRIVVKT